MTPPPPLMAMSVVCALFLSPKINSHCAGTGVSENPYNGLLAIREEMYMNFQSSRLCDTGHLTSVRLKREKDLKNLTRILILWYSKLSIYPTSCGKIEFGSLHPSKIWQPWYTNFGNPENKIACRFWNMPNKNMGSNLISRVAIYL